MRSLIASPLRSLRFWTVLGAVGVTIAPTRAHDDTLSATTDLVGPLGREDDDQGAGHEVGIGEYLNLPDLERLKADSLLEAYPGTIRRIDLSTNRIHYVDGSAEIYDRYPNTRSPSAMINNPDIQDQFYFLYPLTCSATWQPATDFDPGRIRHESFMNHIYGLTESAVVRDLDTFRWLGVQSLKGTKRAGVLDMFSRLSDVFGTAGLADYKKYVRDSAGTYNRRFIAGTRRLSSHSWGNAMDINLDFSDYWKWDADSHGGRFSYKNQIPCRVVEEFEKLGFVWGGKWHHYDTMHFEYRPELIRFAQKVKAALAR